MKQVAPHQTVVEQDDSQNARKSDRINTIYRITSVLVEYPAPVQVDEKLL